MLQRQRAKVRDRDTVTAANGLMDRKPNLVGTQHESDPVAASRRLLWASTDAVDNREAGVDGLRDINCEEAVLTCHTKHSQQWTLMQHLSNFR